MFGDGSSRWFFSSVCLVYEEEPLGGFLVLDNLFTGHVSLQTAPRSICLCLPALPWDFECESLICPGSNIRKKKKKQSLDAEASVLWSLCFSLQSMNHNCPQILWLSDCGGQYCKMGISLLFPRKDRTRKIFVCMVLFTFFLFRPHSFQTTASL